MDEKKLVTRGAFVYNKKTSPGFQKMRNKGAILPPIQLEFRLIKKLEKFYMDWFKSLGISELKKMTKGIVKDAEPIDFEKEDIKRELQNAISSLKYPSRNDPEQFDFVKGLWNMLNGELKKVQGDFFDQLKEDASEIVRDRVSFAIDKDEVFNGRIDKIREYYLDTAIEKIGEGQDQLRKDFIERFDSWISGESQDLDGFDELIEKTKDQSGWFSKFFARDQYARFNKSLTVASFEQAEADYVKWVTVGDGRVRKSHREIQGKIFRIDQLPKEYYDYLCRCCLIPVFVNEGFKMVQKGTHMGIPFYELQRAS